MSLEQILTLVVMTLALVGSFKLKEFAEKHKPSVTLKYQLIEQKLQAMADDNYQVWWDRFRKLSIVLLMISVAIFAITPNGETPHSSVTFLGLSSIAIMVALTALKEWRNILTGIIKAGFGFAAFMLLVGLGLSVYFYFSINFSEYAKETGNRLDFLELILPTFLPIWALLKATLILAAVMATGLGVTLGAVMAPKYSLLVLREYFPNHMLKRLLFFSIYLLGVTTVFL